MTNFFLDFQNIFWIFFCIFLFFKNNFCILLFTVETSNSFYLPLFIVVIS